MVGVVFLLAAGPGQAQKSPLGEAAYKRAQQHLAASRFQEAASEMETAVRYEPRFALGWYVLASAQRRAEHCDEAVFAYRRYMELRPAEAEPYFGVGLCLHALGDRDGATTAFQHYVQGDSRPGSREFVTIARQHLADLERARASAGAIGTSKGGGVAPPAPSAALAEARQLREHGRTEEAIARYRAAIAASDRGSAEAHAELGALLVSARRPGEAVPVLRDAVRLAPTAAQPWYHLGFALRQSGQSAESVAAYRRYITFRPKDPDPHYGLARAYVSLGKDQEALLAFRTYAMLETRPTERQWVKKARLEISRLEGKLAGPTAPAKTATTPATPATTPATTPVTAPARAPAEGTAPVPGRTTAPAAIAPPPIESATPAQTAPTRQP